PMKPVDHRSTKITGAACAMMDGPDPRITLFLLPLWHFPRSCTRRKSTQAMSRINGRKKRLPGRLFTGHHREVLIVRPKVPTQKPDARHA
ncbi:MAG: hypothetical protein KDJ48_06200, partial [Nitratireductor sp.]|nr:hypothetical protein [Nitratireductor sp.]